MATIFIEYEGFFYNLTMAYKVYRNGDTLTLYYYGENSKVLTDENKYFQLAIDYFRSQGVDF